MPSGLMGKPESVEDFERFSVSEITFYLKKDILENELIDNSLSFYIEGYGKYKLEILE